MITVQVEKFTRNIHVAEDPILEYQLNCLLLLVGHQVGWETGEKIKSCHQTPYWACSTMGIKGKIISDKQYCDKIYES